MHSAGMATWVVLLFVLSGFVHSASDDESLADPSSDLSGTYIVKEGENLWSIAANYTNAYDWVKLYEANRNDILASDVIFPGQVLIIPESMLGIGIRVDEVTKAVMLSKPEAKIAETIEGSAQKSNEQKVYDPVLQIDGLVIDETMSKVGRDFYNFFYSEWDSPADAHNYTITVSETPMPNYNTQVTIKVNDTSVFQANLQPRYEEIEGAAQQGVGRTVWYLQNYQTAPLYY